MAIAQIDLSGAWQLSQINGRHRAPMSLPGDVHTALKLAGIIADPYVGRNEDQQHFVAESEWLLERNFVIDDPDGSWYLDITYLDTVAIVFINDIPVLSADNCFQRYRPDVSAALQAGENTIRIHFHSSIAAAAERQAQQPFHVPYSTDNSPIANGNMLRKPQCHFGWDWNIALAPLGLYGDIVLKRLETARIEHIVTEQRHGDGSVELHVAVTLFAHEPAILALHLGLDGERVRLDCGINEGETIVHHVFEIDDPKLWWPNGSGDQYLYDLTIEIKGETLTRQIGLRSVELRTDKDEAGSRFAMRVNGRDIFCRGANWIPADALFSLSSQEKTEALLRSATSANMNMIRVWGGGFYEPDWFYELCDRLGLMVWQDFQFACNLYPSTSEFLGHVADEVDYQVRRLISHPSIVLWCGDNELIGALNWFDVSRRDRDRYLVSYDRLNRTIEQALKKAAPQAVWWPSSPSSGPLDYGDAWHADGSGDMHFWSVWHENRPFESYRSVRPRFCSEFGFQSYASLPVIAGYAEPKDLNVSSPVMEHHQKNAGGNERIAATLFRNFRFPTDFAQFVYLSQVQQAMAIRTAVDYWRSLKPHCMGTLYWQLNDTWPVTSWSSLNYGGGWKLLHYAARRFFQPVTIAAIPSDDGKKISMSVVNDTNDDVTVSLVLTLVSLDGRRHPFRSLEAVCTPDEAVTATTLNADDIPDGCLLWWRFTASNGMDGEGHHVRWPYKALELEPSGLTFEVSPAAPQSSHEGSFEISVSAGGLALFVVLESQTPGHLSDNSFDLAAGESRRIIFTPSAPVSEPPDFRIYDLYQCQSTG